MITRIVPREEIVRQLYVGGYSKDEIADAIGVSSIPVVDAFVYQLGINRQGMPRGNGQETIRAGNNYVSAHLREATIRSLSSGIGVRETAVNVGVNKCTVGKILVSLEAASGALLCQCGRSLRHRGWCGSRFARSAGRQEFMHKKWGRVKGVSHYVRPHRPPALPRMEVWPYIREINSENELLMWVSAAVPRSLPDHIRADICQDILLDILEGKIAIQELAQNVSAAIRRTRKRTEMPFGMISLDAPRRDGRSWYEIIGAIE